MPETRLIDFSKRQLETLLKHVTIGILYLEQDELRGDIKFKTDKKAIELDDLRLFKVQILNAIVTVTTRDITIQN